MKTFFDNYFENYSRVLSESVDINKLSQSISILKSTKKRKKKAIIFGNGGSASIASHFSSDLTNIAKIRCLNFNEPNLITCFANDYGYENWVVKALDYHSDTSDLLILISSSGESKNMLNASKFAKKKKLKLITLTGFSKNNSLSKTGKINFWVNSKKYNVIENIHQTILLSLVDYFL